MYHVKDRYGMFESVTQMLEQLTWMPLSKRREKSRLILFYKIINNLAVVPHSWLEKADVRTRKNHSQKFRHIGYNIDPYATLFNCLPKHIRNIVNCANPIIFKRALDNHLCSIEDSPMVPNECNSLNSRSKEKTMTDRWRATIADQLNKRRLNNQK